MSTTPSPGLQTPRSTLSGGASVDGPDDNIEVVKLRFDTFRAETLPTVELFKSKDKCVVIDTSQDRQTVYNVVRSQLSEFTDEDLAAKPLTERWTSSPPHPRLMLFRIP